MLWTHNFVVGRIDLRQSESTGLVRKTNVYKSLLEDPNLNACKRMTEDGSRFSFRLVFFFILFIYLFFFFICFPKRAGADPG